MTGTMTEADFIERTHAALGRPVTAAPLADDFRSPGVRVGRAGLAECRFLSQPALVDVAAAWFGANRGPAAGVGAETAGSADDASAEGSSR
jgi:hypothetical protein